MENSFPLLIWVSIVFDFSRLNPLEKKILLKSAMQAYITTFDGNSQHYMFKYWFLQKNLYTHQTFYLRNTNYG